MKTFTFKYTPNPAQKAFAALRQAAATGTPSEIHPDTLFCDSFEAMMGLMPIGRFRVYTTIQEYKPESIYQLAKILAREQANVLKDVKALESLGLIRIVSEKNGQRERSRPEALYDKIVFEYEADHQHALG